MSFQNYMAIALEEARAAAQRGEVPVGACVVDENGNVIARAGNRTRELSDPSAHAEVLAIRGATASLRRERLDGLSLYVTLEPCAMCAGLVAAARISRLYFGAADPKSGGVLHGARVFSHPQSHHRPEIYDGINETECSTLLSEFFVNIREKP